MSTPFVTRPATLESLSVFGVDVQVLLDGRQSNGAMAVYRVTAAPGRGAPRHRHVAQDEAFHVLEGAFELSCDGTVERLEAGGFGFAPRGTAHAFTSVGTQPATMIVFSTPAGHEAFFRDCAAAVAAGRFNPETGAAICQRHGIELLP